MCKSKEEKLGRQLYEEKQAHNALKAKHISLQSQCDTLRYKYNVLTSAATKVASAARRLGL